MTTDNHYDAIVIGLGAMGSAALCHLAERGLRVCGIDQHAVPHDFGSSHGTVRVIRKAYFEHPDYIPLLDRAYELWEDLDARAQHRLFVKNGVIVTGSPESETIQGLERCYDEHDLPHEKLEYEAARERFTPFRVPDGHTLFYDPLGGHVYAEESLREHLRRAQAAGAELRLEEKALDWTAGASGVTVTTSKGRYAADRLLLTTGPWAGEFLSQQGIELTITRKIQVWYGAEGFEGKLDETFPCFAIEMDYGMFYGFPPLGQDGMKVGEHSGVDAVARPEDAERGMTPEDGPPLLRFLGEVLPTFKPELKRFSVCLYSNTEDGNFIVDRHPDHDNVIFAAGFSGHGFKFAPVMGEILTDLALNGATEQPIGFLRMDRLTKSRRGQSKSRKDLEDGLDPTTMGRPFT